MGDYVELHAHSCFSLLDGTAAPAALAERAAQLGMSHLALTDHDAVYGVVPFIQAAKARGVKPILGAELTLPDGHLTALVENEQGWRNLCWLITQARHNAPKGHACLSPRHLYARHQGLIILSGCEQGEIAHYLRHKNRRQAIRAAIRYRDIFGAARFYIELQHHLLSHSQRLVDELSALAAHLGLKTVATNNVHYPQRADHALQDVLVCIRNLTTLDASEALRRPNSEFYLKGQDEMAALLSHYPQALRNTHIIAARCDFDLHYGVQTLPRYLTPNGINAIAYLQGLCVHGARRRYRHIPAPVWQRLNRELRIIQRTELANYFLIVWDIVRYARSQGILCQGRGSAANSLVAYLLGITPIDPLAHDLVFERFLSAERAIAPDIDLDIQADRREEVIQYVYGRYGAEHAAMACTLVTYRTRSAVRDVGKALGLPPDMLAQLSEMAADQEPSALIARLLQLSEEIEGLPRHIGIHNGGMIVAGPPLDEIVPTEPATMPNRVVVQWDKASLEAIGLVKIDLLGLRMLSAIQTAQAVIAAREGKPPRLDKLTFDDPAVYDLVCRADTVGVFQLESRSQMQTLPRLKPRCFNDLIIEISLIRPGPIQGQMVHPYLRRRQGNEPVTYDHPKLEAALGETLGVILFQEQVIKVARDLAGFSPGQGELLRRALGAKDAAAAIASFHDQFIAGCTAQGVTRATAERVFDRLRAFGGYSFPKSHAAAFAVLVYQSAWLKTYHPLPLYIGLLNHQPMGFWSPSVVVNDAKRHGIAILPVDIQRSNWGCAAEGEALRLGFMYVRGLGETASARLLNARREQPFADLTDFCRRTRLPRSIVERLIQVGALDSWDQSRRRLLWQLGQLEYREEALALRFPAPDVTLPPVTKAEAQGAEYAVLGLSTGEHWMVDLRPALRRHNIISSAELGCRNVGNTVRIAGQLIAHDAPPTAKDVRFLTLEDEHGFMNVILRPEVYGVYGHILRHTHRIAVAGVVQRRDGVTNVVADMVIPLRRVIAAAQPTETRGHHAASTIRSN